MSSDDIRCALLDDIRAGEPFPPDGFLNNLPSLADQRWLCDSSTDGRRWYVVDERRGPESRIRVWTSEILAGRSVRQLIHDDMVGLFLTCALDNANVQANIESYLERIVNAQMEETERISPQSPHGKAFKAMEGEQPATTVILDCRQLDAPEDVPVLMITRHQLLDQNFSPAEALRQELSRRQKVLFELVRGSPYKGDEWMEGHPRLCLPGDKKRWTLTLSRFMEYEVFDNLRNYAALLDADEAVRVDHDAGHWLKEIYETSLCHGECEGWTELERIDGIFLRESMVFHAEEPSLIQIRLVQQLRDSGVNTVSLQHM